MEDVAVAERNDAEVSVADRVQTIESDLSASSTAAGSVEATSHHADEEGESEICSTAEKSSSFLEDVYLTVSSRHSCRYGRQQHPDFAADHR